MSTLVVVDGPNLTNDVIRFLTTDGTTCQHESLVNAYLREAFATL
jgi:hypothetical protein